MTQFDTSVVFAFQYTTLAFEYRYHPALSPVIWHLLCLEDVIECFYYAFWFVFPYHVDCLYRELIWTAWFSFSHLRHLLLYFI